MPSKIKKVLFCDIQLIDLVTGFDAILTSRQTCEKLQCLYENLKSNNFNGCSEKKNMTCKLKLQNKGLY